MSEERKREKREGEDLRPGCRLALATPSHKCLHHWKALEEALPFLKSISARFHKTPPPQKKHADVESQKEKKYTLHREGYIRITFTENKPRCIVSVRVEANIGLPEAAGKHGDSEDLQTRRGMACTDLQSVSQPQLSCTQPFSLSSLDVLNPSVTLQSEYIKCKRFGMAYEAFRNLLPSILLQKGNREEKEEEEEEEKEEEEGEEEGEEEEEEEGEGEEEEEEEGEEQEEEGEEEGEEERKKKRRREGQKKEDRDRGRRRGTEAAGKNGDLEDGRCRALLQGVMLNAEKTASLPDQSSCLDYGSVLECVAGIDPTGPAPRLEGQALLLGIQSHLCGRFSCRGAGACSVPHKSPIVSVTVRASAYSAASPTGALQGGIKHRNCIYQRKKIKTAQKASAFNSFSRKVEVHS
ncbi:hypothetical protein PANDA_017499 [Ailuropoda melanoleuca]|uniref:Uncharacterized protein n=1 Tax=Ailuropoda melanoleuca TaxID=9646 RepID=D2HXV9_AILME|nr:hypothetical protein PANDA_017499 [Ailuropoda melanoleuca]